MATKKRFSISQDLANGIRNTIQSASTNQGQLHYDLMSIDIIEPDPMNPRKLLITRKDIIEGLNQNDLNYEIKLKEFEALKELAESLKRVGIRNAIEVYKEGQKYRIISGERRYLASLLAGQHSIPVRINHKPDEFKLRYTQWIENINRQDLSLLEKYNNLVSIADAYQKSNNIELDEKMLQSLLGVSNSQCYRYFCLLKADTKIVDLIRTQKIKNLKIIQELMTIKHKEMREQILSMINSSKKEITSLTNYKAISNKKRHHRNTTVNLGTIKNIKIAQYLINTILSDTKLTKFQQQFKDIDWTSSKAISKTFKDLFRVMEKELNIQDEVF